MNNQEIIHLQLSKWLNSYISVKNEVHQRAQKSAKNSAESTINATSLGSFTIPVIGSVAA